VKYVYDEAGRLTEMHTFREGENWSGRCSAQIKKVV